MKKINSKGFTLIELLAVITILGILMLVAIPAVSRTIENSRRDTFADIAKQYLKAVRDGVLADNIECFDGTDATSFKTASALPNGTYYFPICTSQSTCTAATYGTSGSVTTASIETSTKDILESGGKSSFGNAEVQGFVKFVIQTTTAADGGTKNETTYTVRLTDTGKHGMDTDKGEDDLGRGDILTATSQAATNLVSEGRVCKMK